MPTLVHYAPRAWELLPSIHVPDAVVLWCGAWTSRPHRIQTSSIRTAVTCGRCRQKLRRMSEGAYYYTPRGSGI